MPTVRTNGVETYYERRGSGPPIVFVHGAILDHSQVEALSADYETIAYDVRGHGRTGGSPRRSYSVELFAADLAALLDALDVQRPVLCGHSMGGCIAQVYAAEHSDLLAGLVLADTFTPTLFDRSEWVQRPLSLRATVPPVRLLGYERVERALVWFQERLSRSGASGDYERIQRLREDSPAMATVEFAKVIRAVAAFDETAIDLAAIAVPTLVLYGEHDLPVLRRHASAFRAAIPDVSVVDVPGAGHAANLDEPAAFTSSLEAFLATVEPGTAR